jgi:carbamoyltransferase
MLMTVQARPERAARIRGAVHADGTARVQVVRREDNELLWRLLRKVKECTGVGCVINTSFNVKNQPIIRDPATAVRSFAAMALDRLYIEGYRIQRSPRGQPSPPGLPTSTCSAATTSSCTRRETIC